MAGTVIDSRDTSIDTTYKNPCSHRIFSYFKVKTSKGKNNYKTSEVQTDKFVAFKCPSAVV